MSRSLGPSSRSPSLRQTGELPSHQPPYCMNMSDPCRVCRRGIKSRAASVTLTLSLMVALLEKAQRLRIVTDKQALCLRVVFEHHKVGLPSDARDLVPAKGGMRRVEVIAVGQHTARFDAPASAERSGHD